MTFMRTVAAVASALFSFPSRGRVSRWLGVFIVAFSLSGSVDPSKSQPTQYFPASEFQGLASLDKYEPQIWSETLTQFREPSLAAAADHAFTIRITVFPDLSNSTVVRVTQNSRGEVSGISKQLWIRLTGPLVEVPIAVSTTEFDSLAHALADGHFWALTNQKSNIVGGSIDILLEVNDHGKYHAIISNGSERLIVVYLAREMLKLAHLHLPGE